MTIPLFISMLFSPIIELEAENERLRWELQEKIKELNRMEEQYGRIKGIVRNIKNSNDIKFGSDGLDSHNEIHGHSTIIRGIYIPNDVFYYQIRE